MSGYKRKSKIFSINSLYTRHLILSILMHLVVVTMMIIVGNCQHKHKIVNNKHFDTSAKTNVKKAPVIIKSQLINSKELESAIKRRKHMQQAANDKIAKQNKLLAARKREIKELNMQQKKINQKQSLSKRNQANLEHKNLEAQKQYKQLQQKIAKQQQVYESMVKKQQALEKQKAEKKTSDLAYAFLTDIVAKAKQNWSMPPMELDKDLACFIKIEINNQGYLASSTVIHSSGNPAFDKWALAAFKKSEPFVLPENHKVKTKLFELLTKPFKFSNPEFVD